MWNREQELNEFDELADSDVPEEDADSLDMKPSPSASDLNHSGIDLEITNIAEPERAQWREEIQQLGGRSPLLHFVDSASTRIELSTTHPGGLAQFIIGKPTRLSSLIRDPLSQKAALKAAPKIAAKGIELATARGIDSIHLAIGLAEWKYGVDDFLAPILLQPLRMRSIGQDFEIQLKGEPHLNPALKRALAEQFQIYIDAESFVRLTKIEGVFKPQPIIDRLRGITSHLSWFHVQPRLVVSSFAEISEGLLRSSRDLDHIVLNAIAGNDYAQEVLRDSYEPTELIPEQLRNTQTERLVLDADSEQEQVVADIAAGNSVAVRTLPGTGATQTIINAIGALIGDHKRVLVVSPHRASLESVRQGFKKLNLDGIVAQQATLRSDLIRAIGRSEKAIKPRMTDIEDALTRLRQVLFDYRQASTQKHEQYRVSALQALDELARLATLPDSPSTMVRLTPETVTALAEDRSEASELLNRAAGLGEFRYTPADSPWWAATGTDPELASQAHRAAKRLKESLPKLLEYSSSIMNQLNLKQPKTVAELKLYLEYLLGIRENLDRFKPEVYERPLTDLIAATGAKKDSPDLENGNRRSLRKLAKEYLRPGARIDSMHQKLIEIQQQRNFWNQVNRIGATPSVPEGLSELEVQVKSVTEEFHTIDQALAKSAEQQSLEDIEYEELKTYIDKLAEDTEVLSNLSERAEVRQQLHELGLDELVADLANRLVPEAAVPAELELAWWQSALELILTETPALLNANTQVIDRLESDFRLVDEAHIASASRLMNWNLAQAWRIGILDYMEEADKLKAHLKNNTITSETLSQDAPYLGSILAPVWTSSSYLIGQLDPKMSFDVVFLLDASAITLAEAVPSIIRAKQVVAFGDPVSQSPSEFDIAVSHLDYERNHQPSAAPLASALDTLETVLPVHRLTTSYRVGGEDLSELISRRFYAGAIQSLPWAGQLLGLKSLSVDFVETGVGMPDPDSGVIESVPAELERTVELVKNHVVDAPDQSLMVLTASAKHADRLEQAILEASTTFQPLHKFLVQDREEPFMVSTLEHAVAQTRDRVIFSIGYGRTPHGRLLRDLGPLSRLGGAQLLAQGITSARRFLSIVSCFSAEDIEPQRAQHGLAVLAKLLNEAEHPVEDDFGDDKEVMLVDLAERLETFGVKTQLFYRNKLDLVAHFGGKALVIESDRTVNAGSLRQSLRLKPFTLNRLGWHYLRVHDFELFTDPDRVAERAARILGAVSETSYDDSQKLDQTGVVEPEEAVTITPPPGESL